MNKWFKKDALTESEKAELRGVIARGWCHPNNSNKIMDIDLANAIFEELCKFINKDG